MPRSQLPTFYNKREPIVLFDWVTAGQTVDIFDQITTANSVIELLPVGSEPEGFVPGGGRCVKLYNSTSPITNTASVSGLRVPVDLVNEDTIIECPVYYPGGFIDPAASVDIYTCTTTVFDRYHKAYYPAGTDQLKGWNTYSFALQAKPGGVVNTNIGMGKTGSPDPTSMDYFRLALVDSSNPDATYVVIGPITARRRAKTKITISFDDQNLSCYTIAAPILAQYNYKAIAFVSTGLVAGSENKMTWDQIKDINATYGWEIDAHSVTHRNFIINDPLPTDEEILNEVVNSVDELRGRGYPCNFFAWPGGGQNETAKEACRTQNIIACFDIGVDFDPIPWLWPSGEYGRIYRHAVEGATGLAVAINYIDEAIRLGVHFHLYFHNLSDDPTGALNTNTDDFITLMDMLKDRENKGLIDVVTYDELNTGLGA